MALSAILKNERRLLSANTPLLTALFGFLLVFVFALMNGAEWQNKLASTVETVESSDEARTETLLGEIADIEGGFEPVSWYQDARYPVTLGGQRGRRSITLEPGPLAALAVGQSDLLPYYYDVDIYTEELALQENGEIENPLNLMAGRFDLAFALIYLLPLLVLGLSYNVLSEEREQGTLSLLLLQSLTPRSLVRAKLAFRGMVALGLALGATLIGAALFGGLEYPVRLAIWCVAIIGYCGFWLALAGWVNGMRRSSAWNATVLMGAWLFLVVVLPAGLNIASNLLHPVPSRIEMISTAREAAREATNKRSELLIRYLEDHPEMAGSVVPDSENMFALQWAATEEVSRQVNEVAYAHDARLLAQRELVSRYRYLSPALLMQDILTDAAGTGDARYRQFQDQVRAFAEEWRSYFIPPLLEGRLLDGPAVEARPSFPRVVDEASVIVGRITLPFLFLCGWLVVAAFLSRGSLANPAAGSEQTR